MKNNATPTSSGYAPRANVLVKVSGDELDNPAVLEWIREQSSKSWVVIMAGGGTRISSEFTRLGIPIGEFKPLVGRQVKAFEHRQIARDVLERNKTELEDRLAALGIHVAVEIPVLDIGGVLCHVNGDLMVYVAFNSYDRLYVVTTKDRIEKKRDEFRDLAEKVEVIAF